MNRDQRRQLVDRVTGPEYQTNPARDQQVLDALLSRYQDYREPKKKTETIKMILHCRSARAAAVAVVALVVVGGLWQGGTSKAWALEDVLAALGEVRTMYVQGTVMYGREPEPEPKPFRLWVQAPRAESGPLRMRFECSKLVVLLEGERVYMCRPDKGLALLQHGPELEYFMPWYDAAELGPWISSKMYKALRQLFVDWKESEATDPETRRKQIIVSCRYAPASTAIRATVDSDTKLIDEARLRLDSPFRKLKLDVDAQAFTYNRDIPPGTFALPEGLLVIDEAATKKARPLVERAMQVYENEEYAEAIALFGRICDEYPGLYDEACSARMMIGHCYRGLGRKEKAIDAYREALDKINEWSFDNLSKRFLLTITYLSIGRTYAELGQDPKALEAFEACIQQCDGWKRPDEWPHKEALEAIERLRKP